MNETYSYSAPESLPIHNVWDYYGVSDNSPWPNVWESYPMRNATQAHPPRDNGWEQYQMINATQPHPARHVRHATQCSDWNNPLHVSTPDSLVHDGTTRPPLSG